MRPTLLLLVLVTAAVAVPAVPAAAKEAGVRATLDKPVRLGTAPGRTITVAWHLVDRAGQPFGAGGIYLRVSRCGRKPLIVYAAEHGSGAYSARVKVPRGGIRKLLVGLEGWQTIGEKQRRADAFFQFDPPLARRCPS
jgi:hypothetical protein